jgi:hypothetical protein
MGYGVSASGANTMYGTTAYPNHFRYSNVRAIYRTSYSSDNAWMARLGTEVRNRRPAQMRIRDPRAGGHSIVVDGYRTSPRRQIHLNMGWAGSYDGWYVSNNIRTGSYYWSTVSYQGAVVGMKGTGGGSSPTPTAPSGCTTDRTPTFRWSGVKASSWYLQIRRSNKAYRNIRLRGTCTSCRYTLPTSKRLAYSNAYKWRIAAYVSGRWYYSAYKTFQVARSCRSCGFYSNFTSNATGWKYYSPAKWYRGGGNLYTRGYTSRTTFCYYNKSWGSVYDYSARVRRTTSRTYANYIQTHVRTTPRSSTGYPYQGLYYAYANTGRYYLGYIRAGRFYQLRGWTSSSRISKYGWNTMMVKARGRTLYLYMNGRALVRVNNWPFSSGMVDVGMYSTGGTFQTTWAKLVCSNSASKIVLSPKGMATIDFAQEMAGAKPVPMSEALSDSGK